MPFELCRTLRTVSRHLDMYLAGRISRASTDQTIRSAFEDTMARSTADKVRHHQSGIHRSSLNAVAERQFGCSKSTLEASKRNSNVMSSCDAEYPFNRPAYTQKGCLYAPISRLKEHPRQAIPPCSCSPALPRAPLRACLCGLKAV